MSEQETKARAWGSQPSKNSEDDDDDSDGQTGLDDLETV
jgi:hypothetical protein